MVFKVSPNCEKTALNKFNSSVVLSFEMIQAIEVIKLTNSHAFKNNTSQSIIWKEIKKDTPIFFREKAYYIIFEIPRKRPNEQCECDWSNSQISIFYYGSCDTQGMKK